LNSIAQDSAAPATLFRKPFLIVDRSFSAGFRNLLVVIFYHNISEKSITVRKKSDILFKMGTYLRIFRGGKSGFLIKGRQQGKAKNFF
jgi:hypothetical protein